MIPVYGALYRLLITSWTKTKFERLLILHMGASDWAGRMINKMEREFGTRAERAIRITDLVRWMVSEPDFEELRDAGLVDERFDEIFINSLIESLKAQKGETIEERWNTLVSEFGLYEVTGEDVLLSPPDGCSGQQISPSKWDRNPERLDADSENIWIYYITGEGACWLDLDSGEVSNSKRRPGEPPEDGDGYGDWLTGWTSLPDSPRTLSKGQMLEVQLDDREPELGVVVNTDDSVCIRTEYPDHLDEDYISVLAVEDTSASESIVVPEWAEPYRDG